MSNIIDWNNDGSVLSDTDDRNEYERYLDQSPRSPPKTVLCIIDRIVVQELRNMRNKDRQKNNRTSTYCNSCKKAYSNNYIKRHKSKPCHLNKIK
jgi:hypothetical protein